MRREDVLFPSAAGIEHEVFRESVRHFLAAEAGPKTPTAAVLAAAGQHGFLGIAVPEEHGGGGTDDMRFGVTVAEEAMRCGATALGVRYGLHAWVVAPLLARHASAQLQRRVLPGLVSGARIATPAGLHTTADNGLVFEIRDRSARLTGKLSGVVGADGADLLLVVAHSEDGPRIILVEADAVQRHPVLDELGAPGLGTAALVIDVDVSTDNIVSAEDDAVLDRLRADHDLWMAVLGVAGARAALDVTVSYVRERSVFGHPIAEFDNTRSALASVAVHVAAAHALVEECLGARERFSTVWARVATAALAAADAHAESVDQGLQLHGGYGYMREYPIALAFADARRLRLEVLRHSSLHEIVARAVGL